MLSQEEKLDEALKGTFPASDAFYLPPDDEPRSQSSPRAGRPAGTQSRIAPSNEAPHGT
jgi:hypothetical protein